MMVASSIIKYKSGYKYQLVENFRFDVSIRIKEDIHTDYISLLKDGSLYIRKGYAWDGPSGPTIDTKSSLRGSLVHDALYQLMRMGLLEQEVRLIADKIAYEIWITDGMLEIRAKKWQAALGRWAAFAANPKNQKPILIAP